MLLPSRYASRLDRANQVLAELLLVKRRPGRLSPGVVWILAIAILLFAAFLRLHRLTFQPLWSDEIITWVRAGQPTLRQVVEHGRISNWPPGYFLFVHAYMRFLGDSAFALRFPSALAGVLSLAVLFSLGRHLFNAETGLAAALIGAVTWMPIYYSQEARPYTWLFLLSIIMTLCWIYILEYLESGRRLPLKFVIGYDVSAIICVYSHYFGLLLVATHAVIGGVILLRTPRRLLPFGALFIFIGLAYLPWLRNFFLTVDNASTWIGLPAGYPRMFMSYISFLMGESRGLMILFFILTSFALLTFFLQKRPFKRLRLTTPSLLLALILLIPFTITFVRSVLVSPILNYRYLIISAPAVYILLARILCVPTLKRWVQTILVLGFAGYALFYLVWQLGYYTVVTKDDFRQAAAFVMDLGKEIDDESLMIGVPVAGYEYYFEQMGWNRKIEVADPRFVALVDVQQALSTQQPSYVWYLTTDVYRDPAIINYLEEHMVTLEHRMWPGTEVWLFRTQPS